MKPIDVNGKKAVVGLPGGRAVSIADFVAAWRKVKAAPAGAVFNRAFQWWPQSREEILAEFSFGVNDRVNIRGGLPRDRYDRNDGWLALCDRVAAGRVMRECKWCGSGFRPANVNDRFCEASCARSYNN